MLYTWLEIGSINKIQYELVKRSMHFRSMILISDLIFSLDLIFQNGLRLKLFSNQRFSQFMFFQTQDSPIFISLN